MIARMTTRRALEKPTPRINPGGDKVYISRWRDKTGKRRVGYPPDIKGTYKLRRDAQEAIRLCHERDEEGPARMETVGGYAALWLKMHPRGDVTNRTNQYRINAVLDVAIEGAPLSEWPFEQLRRRHANLLIDHLLREDGRAHTGVVNILAVLSAMAEDAIDDEVAVANAFKGVKVRKNDPRIQKASKPVRVFDWEQLHGFARACARAEGGPRDLQEWRPVYAEAMIRTLTDCGLRAGELLALERRDLDVKASTLRVERTTSHGRILQGTKHDHDEIGAGRTVPVPADLLALLQALPPRIGWLFPSPKGRLWLYSTWWAQVWKPGRDVTGMDIRPHEARHSWISLLRGAGVDPADLAKAAGHTEATATARYSHALGRSDDAIRRAVGQ